VVVLMGLFIGLALIVCNKILCFVDHASLYVLVNKTNLVHNLFLVYLSISVRFRLLCAHHQEKQLCLCDTWYLLSCMDDYLVPQINILRQSSTQNNKYQVSHKHSFFSWCWAHSRPKHVEIDKYIKNNCTPRVPSSTAPYPC
jgi:hypothetical protein